MIELNCSYEESKKILELGYDFSSVCDRFIEELTRLKKPEYIEKEHFCIEVFRSEVNQHIKDSWIPLIPKAALEACLPLIDGVIWKRFPAAGDGLLRCTGLNHRTVETCTGFHEFLWCHENYPEELKKKFDEVMA
jgi:hypothetical protein